MLGDSLVWKGESVRKEIWYFAEANLGAARIGAYKYIFLDQPTGWLGAKVTPDFPQLVNLRADPFERSRSFGQVPTAFWGFYVHEFWRFVFVQQEVEKLAKTFIEFPPQQAPASFNLEQVKAKIKNMRNKISHGHVAK